jgi:hypothetical protein
VSCSGRCCTCATSGPWEPVRSRMNYGYPGSQGAPPSWEPVVPIAPCLLCSLQHHLHLNLLEVKALKGFQSMIQRKRILVVHVTSTLERHSNSEFAQHTSIQQIAIRGKLDGQPDSLYNQPQRTSTAWNFIWEGKLKCRSNLIIRHCFNIRGITIDKIVSSGLTGSSTEKGNFRDCSRGRTRGSLVIGNSDMHTIVRGSSSRGEDRGSINRDSVDRDSIRGSHNRGKTKDSNINFSANPDRAKGNTSNWRRVIHSQSSCKNSTVPSS